MSARLSPLKSTGTIPPVTVTFHVRVARSTPAGSLRTNAVLSVTAATTVCAPAEYADAEKENDGPVPAGTPSTVHAIDSAWLAGCGVVSVKSCALPRRTASGVVEAGLAESIGETRL